MKTHFESLLTGTVTAFIKYADMSETNKKILAQHLLWCHVQSKTEPCSWVMEAVRTVLTKEIEKELAVKV